MNADKPNDDEHEETLFTLQRVARVDTTIRHDSVVWAARVLFLRDALLSLLVAPARADSTIAVLLVVLIELSAGDSSLWLHQKTRAVFGCRRASKSTRISTSCELSSSWLLVVLSSCCL